MSYININTEVKKKVDGVVYTAQVKTTAEINVKALDFKNCKEKDGRYVLMPWNPSAADSLFKIFPAEKWDYTFFTVGRHLVDGEPDRPYLYIDVENEDGRVTLEVSYLTEEDYEYLLGVYAKIFPNACLLPAADFQKQLLDLELVSPGTTDSPFINGLDDVIRGLDNRQYLSIRDMIFDRRAEYLDRDTVSFDYEKLYGVIKDELICGLIERANRRVTDAFLRTKTGTVYSILDIPARDVAAQAPAGANEEEMWLAGHRIFSTLMHMSAAEEIRRIGVADMTHCVEVRRIAPDGYGTTEEVSDYLTVSDFLSGVWKSITHD